jgi:hypothetical protein
VPLYISPLAGLTIEKFIVGQTTRKAALSKVVKKHSKLLQVK